MRRFLGGMVLMAAVVLISDRLMLRHVPLPSPASRGRIWTCPSWIDHTSPKSLVMRSSAVDVRPANAHDDANATAGALPPPVVGFVGAMTEPVERGRPSPRATR